MDVFARKRREWVFFQSARARTHLDVSTDFHVTFLLDRTSISVTFDTFSGQLSRGDANSPPIDAIKRQDRILSLGQKRPAEFRECV